MPDEPRTEADAIAEVALMAAEPNVLEAGDLIGVPNEVGQTVIDLEEYLPAPRRTRGTYIASDTESFHAYAARFADPEQTTVWVDQPSNHILAVLDDAAPDKPAWGQHRLSLTLKRTPEWNHWLGKDGNLITQEQFAEHIQEGLLEITDPDHADILEIAQTIQGSTNANWKAASRLDNGAVGFEYTEEVTAAAGRTGKMEIPQQITLGVALFEGEDPVEVRARLRYRVRGGVLTIGYKLDRPHEAEKQAVDAIVESLRGNDALKQVYLGVPPQA